MRSEIWSEGLPAAVAFHEECPFPQELGEQNAGMQPVSAAVEEALSRSVSSSSATINSGPLEYCCGSTPEQVCPPCSGQAHWVNHPAPQEPLPLNKCLFTKLVAVVLDELTHRSECTAVMEHYVVKQDLWYWFLKICILKVSGVKQSSLVL